MANLYEGSYVNCMSLTIVCAAVFVLERLCVMLVRGCVLQCVLIICARYVMCVRLVLYMCTGECAVVVIGITLHG